MKTPIEKLAYDALRAVFVEKQYSTIALNGILKNALLDFKANVTAIFYGVLENNLQFDFYINKLVQKKPAEPVVILLKIGLYLILKSNTPDYAAVNKTVELAKNVGKGGTSGFINAVLKKANTVKMPPADTIEGLSINSSFPVWILKKLQQQHDFNFAKNFALAAPTTKTHIRVNLSTLCQTDFDKKYPFLQNSKSQYGYFVDKDTQNKLDKTDYIIQSLASITAIQYATENLLQKAKTPKNILDLCASPGGKAVYLKQLFPLANVVACDIYAHRVQLINQYASATGTNISTKQNDATIINKDFLDGFDLVLCDVPCSGIGTAYKKPDVLIVKKESDLASLSAIQAKILQTALHYVKKNGLLIYSTCTVFNEENENIVDNFLAQNTNFKKPKPYLNLTPHTDNTDGFFAAVLQKL